MSLTMSSDSHPLVRIINISQDLERRLKERYGVSGDGLGQLLARVGDKIPDVVRKKIWKIVGVRNKAAHVDVGVAEENANSVDECYRYILIAFSHSDADLEAFAQAYDTLEGIVDYYVKLLDDKYGTKQQSSLNAKVGSVEKRLPKGVSGKLHKIAHYFNKATFNNISVAYDNLELVLKLDQTVKKILRNSEKNDVLRKNKNASPQKKRAPTASSAPRNHCNSRRTNNETDVRKASVPTPNYRTPRYVAPSSSFPKVAVSVALGIFIVVVILGVVWLCRSMAS